MRDPASQSPPTGEPPSLGAMDADLAGIAGEPDADARNGRFFGISVGKAGAVVIGFTAFLLVLLWGAVAYQLNHDKNAVLEAARTNATNLARAYGEHVLGTLKLIDQMLLRVATEFQKNSVSPDLEQRLQDASTLDRGALLLAVADEHGRVVATTVPLPPSARDVSDRDYFRAHTGLDSDQLYISEPLFGRITGKQVVALSRGLRTARGAFGGVVLVSFDPQYLSGFFSDLTISKDSSFAVIGRDMIVRDMIRGSGRATEVIGKSVANSALARALAKAPNGDYEAAGMLDGVARLYAYRTLPDYPIIVVASIGEADVLASFHERRARLIGAAMLLSLIFVAVALFQLRRITAQARSERTLRQTQALLLESQRAAKLGYIVRDMSNNRLYLSDSMFELRGIPRRPFLTIEEAAQFTVPEDRGRYAAARQAAIAERRGFTIDVRVRRPDGTVRWEHRTAHPHFNVRGELVRILTVAQDITERRDAEERERELERKLMHSQKLEALGTLAGGIAHDLNNTLTPIMALSKITARQLDQGSAVRANLETIFRASEQARDLVKRVLAFSRPDKVDKKPTNLREVASDALKLLRATIPTSIELDVTMSDVPPILADASQMHQVITNLVSNAAQAIGGPLGTITVRLELMPAQAMPQTIRLSVTDTGQGMDEATRRRIFEPFFTTKQVGQGTGLGLAIIESIVADHGGRIEVESEPGKGARFDIYLPVPETAASAAA